MFKSIWCQQEDKIQHALFLNWIFMAVGHFGRRRRRPYDLLYDRDSFLVLDAACSHTQTQGQQQQQQHQSFVSSSLVVWNVKRCWISVGLSLPIRRRLVSTTTKREATSPSLKKKKLFKNNFPHLYRFCPCSSLLRECLRQVALDCCVRWKVATNERLNSAHAHAPNDNEVFFTLRSSSLIPFLPLLKHFFLSLLICKRKKMTSGEDSLTWRAHTLEKL